ncbi:ClC family H(+)/Cl(-) exchange transporter [Pyrococcus abyssi]|uniref:EriC voltage gated chloride channel n=1 Tax=Pyrococcus abyssi (strain GE5 / Orsay) TaxID=272844 RepID=Q9V1A3_PYRAB|nr:ClC family H(+)/Cl(-) exchange transporter [Pyrococcus abyssi]CAB49446.1 eriC voltage gated chloride channel [Pyrococcus abyssi GE5]CCE69913.1 TPA: hypothetical protein PAB2010 [Pyrococcus abyssi GE5]
MKAYTLVKIGVLAGVIVGAYKLLVKVIESYYLSLARNAQERPVLLVIWIVLTLFSYYIISRLLNREPNIARGGILQIKEVISGTRDYNPVRVIVGKIIGHLLALISGLSLGKAGPSIQLGGSIAMIFSKKKVLIGAGAAAGLSAAFEAPIAGIVSTFEILRIEVTPPAILYLAIPSLISALISHYLFPVRPTLVYTPSEAKDYQYLILLGVTTGAYSSLFIWLIKHIRKIKLIIPFFESWILLPIMPLALGGGHALIFSLFTGNFGITFLLLLLLLKSIHTILSYTSGAPGGLFLPSLAIGAIIGKLFVETFGVSNTFVLAGMVGVLSGTLRAPMTGAILMAEITKSPRGFLDFLVAGLSSYATSYALKKVKLQKRTLR